MEFYVAIPKSIVDIYWNGLPETSEALGMFIVKPELSKVFLGKSNVVSFNEAITGEKIVNRISYGTEYGVDYVDKDCMIENEKQIGDLEWEIIDKSTAERLLTPQELEKYMAMTSEEIRGQLTTVREQAKTRGQEFKSKMGKK